MTTKIVCYCSVMIVFASHNSLAQSIPPLNELVKRIEMVSLPNKPYTVSVSQAIEYSRRVKTQSVSPKAVSGVSTFGYIYDPKAGTPFKEQEARVSALFPLCTIMKESDQINWLHLFSYSII